MDSSNTSMILNSDFLLDEGIEIIDVEVGDSDSGGDKIAGPRGENEVSRYGYLKSRALSNLYQSFPSRKMSFH